MPLGQLPPPTYRGRQDLLGRVRTWSGHVADDRGGVMVIEGGAGFGKSRLLAELDALPELADVNRRRATADRFELGRPFAVWRDLLDARHDPALRAELDGPDSPSDGASPDQHRFRVQDILLDRVDDLLQEGPLLLLVDDVQWADPASVLTLAALARRPRDEGLGLAIALRPHPRSPEIGHLLEQVHRHGGWQISLDPLGPDDVRAIADEVAGWVRDTAAPGSADRVEGRDRPPPDHRDVDLHRIGGNPYLAVVLGGWGRQSLLDRLDLHDAATIAVLRACAVVGRTATPSLLAEVSGIDPDATGTILQRLVADGVLADPGGTSFHHELVRDAVLDGLAEDEVRALHRRVVEVLVAHGAPPTAVQRHVVACASIDDPAAEADALLLRDAATRLLPSAPEEAADLLRLATQLLPPRHPEAVDLLIERVRAELWTGRLADALAGATGGLARLDPAGPDGRASPAADSHARDDLDARHRIALHRAAAEALHLGGNRGAALPHLQAALALETAPTQERAELLAQLAAAQLWTVDVEASERSAADAIALSEAIGAVSPAVGAWLVRCRLAALRGDVPDALSYGDRALALAASDPSTLRRGPAVYLGLSLLNNDQPDEAIDLLQRGTRQCQEAGLPAEEAQHHAVLALVGWMAGRWDVARAAAASCRSLAADTGAHSGLPTVESTDAWVAFLGGDLAEARAAHDRAAEELARPGAEGNALPYLLWLEARMAEHDGDLVRAAEVLGSVWELAHEVAPAVTIWFAADLVRMQLAAGRPDEAAAVAVLADELAPRTDTPTARGAARLSRALLASDPDEGLAAIAELRSAPRPDRFVDGAVDVAGLLGGAGRAAEATSLLSEAAAVADELGAVTLGRRVTAATTLLDDRPAGPKPGGRPRRAGAARPSRPDRTDGGVPPNNRSGSSIWTRISPAEREVALLVAEGLSNPRIAERLYVSRRTVESHVSSLLRKLNVPNRVTLAALVLQADSPVEPASPVR